MTFYTIIYTNNEVSFLYNTNNLKIDYVKQFFLNYINILLKWNLYTWQILNYYQF